MKVALLHDVVDDTRVSLDEVEAYFGIQIRALVATVTQLSQMNQLMRRKQRQAREQVGRCRPTSPSSRHTHLFPAVPPTLHPQPQTPW